MSNNFDTHELVSNFHLALQQKGLKRINIMIHGKDEVGTPTLINKFVIPLYFTHCTNNEYTNVFMKDDIIITFTKIPSEIYPFGKDKLCSVGSEVESKELRQICIQVIQQLAKKSEETIDLVWMCIAEDTWCVDEEEIETVRNWTTRNIPVIVVINKSRHTKPFKTEVQRLIPEAYTVISVGEMDKNIDTGIYDLIESSIECIIKPEIVNTEFRESDSRSPEFIGRDYQELNNSSSIPCEQTIAITKETTKTYTLGLDKITDIRRETDLQVGASDDLRSNTNLEITRGVSASDSNSTNVSKSNDKNTDYGLSAGAGASASAGAGASASAGKSVGKSNVFKADFKADVKADVKVDVKADVKADYKYSSKEGHNTSDKFDRSTSSNDGSKKGFNTSFDSGSKLQHTWKNSIEDRIQKHYNISQTVRNSEVSNHRITVPANTKIKIAIKWKRIWQDGQIIITDTLGRKFEVDYKISDRITYDLEMFSSPQATAPTTSPQATAPTTSPQATAPTTSPKRFYLILWLLLWCIAGFLLIIHGI